MGRSVKVVEISSGEVLFSCDIAEREKAYDYAEQMEAMGLDIKLELPSAPETLATSLGASEEDLEKLKTVIDDEIESHDPTIGLGCAVCLPETDLEQ